MKQTTKCLCCGEEFTYTVRKDRDRKYCSPRCYRSHGMKQPKPERRLERVKANCKGCGKEFEHIITDVQKYCSFRCYRDKFKNPEIGKVVECANCGKEFSKRYEDQKVCSKDCSIEVLIKSNDGVHITEKECVSCGKVFKPRENKRKHCSKKCLVEYRAKQRVVKCECCGTQFKRKSIAHRYCSIECRSEANKGDRNATFKGYITDNGGYVRYTPQHPKYPGGYEHNVIWWKANPHGVCNRCGDPVEHIHHIDRNKKNNDLSNLEGLCMPCHMKEHWKDEFLKHP